MGQPSSTAISRPGGGYPATLPLAPLWRPPASPRCLFTPPAIGLGRRPESLGPFNPELSNIAPETLGIRRQRFTLYYSLLVPTCSPLGPPGGLATPLPRLPERSTTGDVLRVRGRGPGGPPPATTIVPRLRYSASTPGSHLGEEDPAAAELLRFLLVDPPRSPLDGSTRPSDATRWRRTPLRNPGVGFGVGPVTAAGPSGG